MTRRRLILAIVAAVLCGVAWCLSLDRLSAEELLLVGTWTFGHKLGPGEVSNLITRSPREETRHDRHGTTI
jgi:hypothetical protein